VKVAPTVTPAVVVIAVSDVVVRVKPVTAPAVPVTALTLYVVGEE